ncbi:MAG: DUF1731 domain-containing protein, partial [Phycisphaerales bacterium]
AVGYYGDRPGETLDESSAPGDDFRARVCAAWERAAERAHGAGVRVVTMRIGNVLGAKTPLLDRLLPVWKCGLGGPFGSGDQRWPWIGLDDLLGAVEFLLHTQEISGPVNLVAPQRSTNGAFARALARVVRRPALGVYPAWALKMAFGQLAEEALLSSQDVAPSVLTAHGFEFLTPTLDECLRWELDGFLAGSPDIPAAERGASSTGAVRTNAAV